MEEAMEEQQISARSLAEKDQPMVFCGAQKFRKWNRYLAGSTRNRYCVFRVYLG
jgi:hypothetical protein